MEIPELQRLRKQLLSRKARPFVVLIPFDSAILRKAEEILKEYLHHFSPRTQVFRFLFASHGGKKKTGAQLDELLGQVRVNSLQQALFRESHLFVVINYPPYATDAAEELLKLSSETNAILLAVENPKSSQELVDTVGREGIVVSVRNLARYQARQAVLSAAQIYGMRLATSAVDAILELVGTDRGYIESAVQILAEAFGHEQVISAEDCRKVITKKTKVMPWDLTDAIGSRDLAKAVKFLRLMLEEGTDALKLLATIQRHVQQLAVAQGVAREKDPEGTLQRVLGVPKFVAGKLLAQTRNFTEEELARFLARLPLLEARVKSHMSDPWAVLVDALSSLIVKGNSP